MKTVGLVQPCYRKPTFCMKLQIGACFCRVADLYRECSFTGFFCHYFIHLAKGPRFVLFHNATFVSLTMRQQVVGRSVVYFKIF